MMVPKLVYDDDCHFCTWSATFAVRQTNIQPVRLSRVQSETSRLNADEPDRLPDGYEECAQLLTEDAVHSCGAAMEQSLILAGVLPESLVEILRRFDGYERLRERGYYFLSNNRDHLAKVIGRNPPVSQHISEESIYPERRS